MVFSSGAYLAAFDLRRARYPRRQPGVEASKRCLIDEGPIRGSERRRVQPQKWPDLAEEDRGQKREGRNENRAGPEHEAEKARHFYAEMLRDGLDHEIRRIADIGVGAHEHGPRRDRGQQRMLERGVAERAGSVLDGG